MLRPIRALLAIIAFALAACSSPQAQPVQGALQGDLDGAPDWVLKSCNAYFGAKETGICGLGSTGGTRNITLARNAAIANGRNEIARSLEVKVKAMLKQYAATTTGGEGYGTSADDEQHIVDVSKQVTNMTLSGTKHVDTWVSPKGTLFALVVLDVEAFKDSLKQMKQLDEKVKEAIIERADKAFKELDVEIEKPQ